MCPWSLYWVYVRLTVCVPFLRWPFTERVALSGSAVSHWVYIVVLFDPRDGPFGPGSAGFYKRAKSPTIMIIFQLPSRDCSASVRFCLVCL